MQKQVEKEHYIFTKYLNKGRWPSIWHQLDEVSKLSPKSVLEIGPGSGVFKANASVMGLNVDTVDLDPELKPDYVASATELPFEQHNYDLVCAFQVLEHMPFESSLKAFTEMCRVARKNIIISLPDAKVVYACRVQLPKLGVFWFNIPRPTFGLKKHVFDGEHYWEINKKGYSINKITNALLGCDSGYRLQKTYRVVDNPYHRFFVFERTDVQ
jgi:2-polyprenyl-3-methyl-5-hydroxy-6-metoxy-1,4-benzoquinol methylase